MKGRQFLSGAAAPVRPRLRRVRTKGQYQTSNQTSGSDQRTGFIANKTAMRIAGNTAKRQWVI
jgi:hypothetical protein